MIDAERLERLMLLPAQVGRDGVSLRVGHDVDEDKVVATFSERIAGVDAFVPLVFGRASAGETGPDLWEQAVRRAFFKLGQAEIADLESCARAALSPSAVQAWADDLGRLVRAEFEAHPR